MTFAILWMHLQHPLPTRISSFPKLCRHDDKDLPGYRKSLPFTAHNAYLANHGENEVAMVHCRSPAARISLYITDTR
jgi:hypothetical protein